MKLSIKVSLSRGGGLFEKVILINDENFYRMRFALEYELQVTRKKLKRLQKEGIITNLSKSPKVLDRKCIHKVKIILYSRRSLLRNLRLLRNYQ